MDGEKYPQQKDINPPINPPEWYEEKNDDDDE